MMFVGFLFILLGYLTARKLKSVGRRSMPADELRSKFDKADENKTGELDLGQFSNLVDEFNFGLSRREKEIAFIHLDTSDRGSLTFEEFKAWFEHVDDVAPIL